MLAKRKIGKDNPLERNGEAISESIIRCSQRNFLLGFRDPADSGGIENILLDGCQAWCGDKACEGGDSRYFETEELLEVVEAWTGTLWRGLIAGSWSTMRRC